MRDTRLGTTDLFVSELCLGTMTFGGGDAGIWSHIGQLGQDEVATSDELAAIDAVSALPSEYPGWMFERQGATRRSQISAERGADGR